MYKKIFSCLLIFCLIFSISCGKRGKPTTTDSGSGNSQSVTDSESISDINLPEEVVLSITSKQLKIGENVIITATVLPENVNDKTVLWDSDNKNVATCSGGVVTAVGMGKAVITATAVNGVYSACEIEVVRVIDDGLEMNKEGYIYYEDFTKRVDVPDYFTKDITGFSHAKIEDGALRMTVIDEFEEQKHAFLMYEFKNPLTGKVTVEAKIKVDSNVFSNILFFFTDTANFYDTSKIVTNVGMQGMYFKNNAGSGWNSTNISYETGKWYELKMVIDTDKEVYHLSVGEEYHNNLSFRNRGKSIKYLCFGADKSWADISYEYLRIREYKEGDINEGATVNYYNSFDGTTCPTDISSRVIGSGVADFSKEGLLTLSTPSSGSEVYVDKIFDKAFEGRVAFEVNFANHSSVANTFANVLFIRNSSLSGTAGNAVTVAVEQGRLRYHHGGSWKTVQYGGSDLCFVDDAYYTLKAVCDFDAKKTKLYISGSEYIKGIGGDTAVLGTDIYLGEFDFRNSSISADNIEFAIGTGKLTTSFSVDYFKVYTVSDL